jgi:hypothetical protein
MVCAQKKDEEKMTVPSKDLVAVALLTILTFACSPKKEPVVQAPPPLPLPSPSISTTDPPVVVDIPRQSPPASKGLTIVRSYLDDLKTGGDGLKYVCTGRTVEIPKTLTEYSVLKLLNQGNANGEAYTVRIHSSSEAGSPIIKNWMITTDANRACIDLSKMS